MKHEIARQTSTGAEERLRKLESSFDSAVHSWAESRDSLLQQLAPLGTVPKSLSALAQELRNDVRRKADGSDVVRMQMELDALQGQLVTVADKQAAGLQAPPAAALPPEVQDLLVQVRFQLKIESCAVRVLTSLGF